MARDTSIDRHSSVVTLQLELSGRVYPLAQIGPDFVVLQEPARFSAGRGTLVMESDGTRRTWDVRVSTSDGSTDVVRIAGV
ncbi:MAG: hypothetical protein ACF8TS_17815 [Maioricimonas sp. JB049]